MYLLERDLLKVEVPVGFLLTEPREIAVSIDRPSDTPLSIRLRLVPAVTGDTPSILADARSVFAHPSRSL